MIQKLKALLVAAKQKLGAFVSLAEKDFSELWNEYKTVLILAGGFIVVLKFRTWLANFLISGSKQVINSAQKQSQSEQLKENQDNQQADTLVQQAQKLDQAAKDQEIEDNWYKNE